VCETIADCYPLRQLNVGMGKRYKRRCYSVPRNFTG
jgi:hypothetical protein